MNASLREIKGIAEVFLLAVFVLYTSVVCALVACLTCASIVTAIFWPFWLIVFWQTK